MEHPHILLLGMSFDIWLESRTSIRGAGFRRVEVRASRLPACSATNTPHILPLAASSDTMCQTDKVPPSVLYFLDQYLNLTGANFNFVNFADSARTWRTRSELYFNPPRK